MLTNLLNKIKNLIKRGVITNVDKSTEIYSLQLKSYGLARNASMLMPYGLICDPINDSECITFSLGGDGSRMFAIPYNPSLIPSTSKGDVGLYSNKTTKIILEKDGNILIKTNKDVTVECDNLIATVNTKASINAPTIENSCTTATLNATTSNITATTINKQATTINTTATTINETATKTITGILNVIGSYQIGGVPGATGTFTTVDGKTVTVTNGIITAIV